MHLRPFAWALLGVVLLDAACRIFLPTGQLERAFEAGRARVEDQPAPAIQLLGDSVAAGGIFTDLIGSTDLSIRNDAIQATSPVHSYLLFKQELQAGRRPQHLLIAHHPRTFATVRVPVLVAGFAYWSEVPGIVTTFGGSRDANYGVLTKLSYLLHYREQFRALLTRADTSWLTDSTVAPLAAAARIAAHLNQQAQPDFRLVAPDPQELGLQRRAFVVSAQNDFYFRKLLALAKREHVAVYWVDIPISPQVRAVRAGTGHDAQLKKYLQQFVKSGELSLLGEDALVLPADHFEDWSHVNTAGAIRFSCYLGQLWRTQRLQKLARAGAVSSSLEPQGEGTMLRAVSIEDEPAAAVCKQYSQDRQNAA